MGNSGWRSPHGINRNISSNYGLWRQRSCVDPRAHLCTPGLEPTQLQLKLKVERPVLQGGVDTGKQSWKSRLSSLSGGWVPGPRMLVGSRSCCPRLSMFLWVKFPNLWLPSCSEKLVKNACLPLSLASQSLNQLCTPFEPSKKSYMFATYQPLDADACVPRQEGLWCGPGGLTFALGPSLPSTSATVCLGPAWAGWGDQWIEHTAFTQSYFESNLCFGKEAVGRWNKRLEKDEQHGPTV